MNSKVIQELKNQYNVNVWGDGFFDISSEGEVLIAPNRSQGPMVSCQAIVNQMIKEGIKLPALVRFPDILKQRLQDMHVAFANAIQQEQYQGHYTPVYPIKVNQHKRVVETLAFAEHFDMGLESGSKAELLVILSLAMKAKLLICNGYKDKPYLQLALVARALGHRCYIIIEKLSELVPILELSASMQVEPLLGVRVRLSSLGVGKWQNTGGLKAKFGLTATQVITLIKQLQQKGYLHCLKMLHFHMGSQIANIRDIQEGLREGGRYYVELRKLGAPITIVDVGGGLGVDYEGTRTRSFCSINYTIDAYANHVVHTLKNMVQAENLPHPDIITEAGRAMAAHHAVLVHEVVDYEHQHEVQPLTNQRKIPIIEELKNLLHMSHDRSAIETYHDACYWLSSASTLYVNGLLSLEERAQCEQLVIEIWKWVQSQLHPRRKAHRAVYDELNDKLADKLFCNFSLFQSVPDVWAIEQIFPIMPLKGLLNHEQKRYVVEDITCDSDGRFDYYIDGQSIETTLLLPTYSPQQPYCLGVFLVGAYQEILGDKHNLFGTTNTVEVHLTENGFKLTHIMNGDTVEDVLRFVRFEVEQVRFSIQQQLTESKTLTANIRDSYLKIIDKVLKGYTYLES